MANCIRDTPASTNFIQMPEWAAGPYYSVQYWMGKILGLKGNEKEVYAVIYGFTQTVGSYQGSVQYIADLINATREGVSKNLKKLVEKGFLIKEAGAYFASKEKIETSFMNAPQEQQMRPVLSVKKKSVSQFCSSVNAVPLECEQSSHNNILNNNFNTIDLHSFYPSEEVEEKSESTHEVKSCVKKQIQYDELLSENPHSAALLDDVVGLITDVAEMHSGTVRCAGEKKAAVRVQRQFARLSKRHIAYVLRTLENNRFQVRNVRNYVLTLLYNSVLTGGIDQTAKKLLGESKQQPYMDTSKTKKGRFFNFDQRNTDYNQEFFGDFFGYQAKEG